MDRPGALQAFKHSTIAQIYVAFASLWVVAGLAALAAPDWAWFVTRKEGPVEHVTHAALLAATLWHGRLWWGERGSRRHLFLALVSLLFFLEETDYLQLYVGFPTPTALRPFTGRSDALNFHNTRVADVLLPAFYTLYFIVLPVAAALSGLARHACRVGLHPLRLSFAGLFWLCLIASILLGLAGRARVDAWELLDMTLAFILLFAAGLGHGVFVPLARDQGGTGSSRRAASLR